MAALGGCAAPRAGVEASSATDLSSADANAFFTTEWGPTPFNAAGHPDGFSDCGPTSLLMAGAFFGFLEPPTATGAEDMIRHVRDLTRGEPTPASGPTFVPMMVRGAAAIGMTGSRLPIHASDVRAALERGSLVVLAGDPRTAWGFDLDAQKSYLHHYGAPGPIPPPADGKNDVNHFGHWVVAFGLSPSGSVIIGDPLSTTGTIEVTDDAIDQYFVEWPAKSAALELAASTPKRG
jgi:hypothetical protein